MCYAKLKSIVSRTTLESSTQASVTEVDCIAAESRVAYIVVFLIVTALLILPIWTVSIVPWVDYGDHLARIFIERYYDTVPVFSQYYQVAYRWQPNLAVDLVGVELLRWFDPDTAAHLFASLSVLIFAAGCHLFGKAVHGAPTWLSIPAAFFFYNSLLIQGLVNYMWGVALFLIAAAAWMRFAQKPGLAGGAGVALLGLATYFAHLSGFFFLCSFVGLYVATEVVERRRIELRHVFAFAPLVPGLVTYAVFRQTDKADLGALLWNSMSGKLVRAWVLFAGYSAWMDLMTAIGLAATAILLWRYAAKVSLRRSLLVISAVYLLVFLCSPGYFHTGSEADTRFLPVAALVAILSVVVRLPRFPARLIYVLLLAVSVARIGAMTFYWHQADIISREQRSLLREMPENSRILPMVFLSGGRTAKKLRQQLFHLGGYATVDRHAIVGSTFTVKGQQPLQRRIPMWFSNWYANGEGVTAGSFDWARIFADYDYIWAYEAVQPVRDFLDKNCDLTAQAEEGRLYRVRNRQP